MPSIVAGELRIAYSVRGSDNGAPVLMLHGWPDDASTWEEVAEALAGAGHRVIVPTLRGFGETRFRSDDTPRTGNSAVLAIDAIALMDALHINRFAAVGHDWGSNAVEALAVGWPERVTRMAMFSTPPRLGGMQTPPFWHAEREWYHWFMATARGAEAVRADRRGFARRHWENWAPPGWFSEALFQRVARSWDNPDWIDVTLHSYRSRWDEAEPDPTSRWLEDKIKATRTLSLPTLYIQGAEDGVNPPAAARSVPDRFDGRFDFVQLAGIGHFPQREAPGRVAAILLDFLADRPLHQGTVMTRNNQLATGLALGGVALLAGIAAAGLAGRRSPKLKRVARFDHQVTGVAATADGRLFVNFPRWTDDAPVSVAQVLPDGSLKLYPDEHWNAWRNAKANEMPVDEHFVCVQSIVPDGQGSLWVLDPGAPGNEKILPGAPKLVRIDLSTDRVTKVVPVAEEVALQGSYLNDIRFSSDGRTGYITDSGARGAIIVIDLETGAGFRALDGHPSTQVDPNMKVAIGGKPLVRPDGRQPVFASDGIAISNDGATLYWQALTGRTLFAIDTALLRPEVSEQERAAGVRTVATTHVADGLWMTRDGTLFLTSPTDFSVTRLAGAGVEHVLTDHRLRWPDTFSEGPDGRIYLTASHIQDTYWFKPGAPASVKTALFCFDPRAG